VGDRHMGRTAPNHVGRENERPVSGRHHHPHGGLSIQYGPPQGIQLPYDGNPWLQPPYPRSNWLGEADLSAWRNYYQRTNCFGKPAGGIFAWVDSFCPGWRDVEACMQMQLLLGQSPALCLRSAEPDPWAWQGQLESRSKPIRRLGRDARKKKDRRYRCSNELRRAYGSRRSARRKRECDDEDWTTVYRFIRAGKVIYVGITNDYARRMLEHRGDPRLVGATSQPLVDVPYRGVAKRSSRR
jgi:hypothetical protein